MPPVISAAALYFAIVFAAGFGLGTLRVFVIAPALGEGAAVALELPVMLALSWLACRQVLLRIPVAPSPAPRLAMGGLAFALLMAAELVLSVAAFGRTVADHIAAYQTAPALLGLAGQIAFALFPLTQARRTPHRAAAR